MVEFSTATTVRAAGSGNSCQGWCGWNADAPGSRAVSSANGSHFGQYGGTGSAPSAARSRKWARHLPR
ncbi:hypothetical protein [Micromonospora echinospora]|uniref:hypothetical protein n=1 Tax=Micromonospora echinospora TaxID=1877 RepID=UPI003A887257